MKAYLFTLIFLQSCILKSQPANDGPYVSYTQDQIFIKRVVNGEVLQIQRPLKEKQKVSVQVTFDKVHEDWNFSVNLKSELRNEPSTFAQAKKLFFASDIEGEFEGFRMLLISNNVIDEKYNWTFGKGHLILCGDLFDRGSYVPETLWLIYKLEQEAIKSGGYVHTILGNHDIMNLSGDFRYAVSKYASTAKAFGVDQLALYDKTTELGRWLRTKNTIEKIGDNLCAHAGISPQITQLHLPLQVINDRCRPYYDNAKMMNGVADPTSDIFFKAETSLFWYRGYFMDPKVAVSFVDSTLAEYNVKRIVVGHTIVNENINFYYDKKVLGLDVNQHAGRHQAVLNTGEKWFRVNDKGETQQL
jgi:hypothetical protein